ncbi:MAG: thioredoxin domain-containing protein [Deltaproteobacteria bacterium]|nr:MAG: thioredoxin domain-containing protein [Deltaproteobacteria bacterium]
MSHPQSPPSNSSPKPHQNRLALETSPYLLQHADNPVDWYPWGPEALERAQAEDRPILLSIGYAACHWCHVMERESFTNEATAQKMNDHFVCIKVDREERVDIDDVYMAAAVAMTGSGGWPLTVFLTPDKKPFFAGTYFPPVDMLGRPSFSRLLDRIATLWQDERDPLITQAATLTEHLEQLAEPAGAQSVSPVAIDRAVAQLGEDFDPRHGGFGPAPKFPAPMSLELLLRHHRRTGDEQALIMAVTTLDGMAKGGMRDHLGGGFARYSTDERWLVPHFEKMLYDNAALARIYGQAFQVTGAERFARVACETLDYVLREMQSPVGGFYSATDADSEGVEGKFFLWTPDEIAELLPADQAEAWCAYYDVTAAGNWEGKSILHTPRELPEVAAELGCSVPQLEALLATAQAPLLAARLERVPPLLDDKILTSWNGLMIGALAECSRIFDEPRYLTAAERAADFTWSHMRRDDGGLHRTYRAGKAHLDGYLEDYATLCDAFIDLHEASGDSGHLQRAGQLAQRLITDFQETEPGAFYATAHHHEALPVRMRSGQDGAMANANAVAALALARLSLHSNDDTLRQVAEAAIAAHGKLIERAPRAFASSLKVTDLLAEGPLPMECAAGRPAG